jgi:hypothetical protein
VAESRYHSSVRDVVRSGKSNGRDLGVLLQHRSVGQYRRLQGRRRKRNECRVDVLKVFPRGLVVTQVAGEEVIKASVVPLSDAEQR